MNQTYPTHTVEAKWQQRWEADKLYRTDLDHARRPFYNLMEFPYPSGEGLHVGHVYTYCGADALGRLRRMQGYDVFQPMGFDAFGIHSENYALKVGINPAVLTPANIRRFREEQLQRLGCQFDWSRVVDTTDPGYYRWTQWIFVQLFKAGLAYQSEAPVNWCPACQTVLANEQVIDGRCERCDTPMIQRVMRQWFLRITQYADKLLDFSTVDFPESSIKRQSAWIGRSVGAEIRFQVADSARGAAHEITTFTTRPDTIFGATFIALAPEHPLVATIATEEQRAAVQAYVGQSQRKLERERLIGAEKSGVFTGAYAINPATGGAIPIWVADYVLARYGAGSIMGVPAHDQRDFTFAQAYGLPVIEVIAAVTDQSPELQSAAEHWSQAYEGEGVLINAASFDGMDSAAARAAIIAWLEQQGSGQARVSYRLRDWLVSRQRYWGPPIPIVYCASCGTLPVPEDQLPVLLPPTENFRPTGSELSPLAAIPDFVNTTCPQCSGAARRETDVSDNFLDSAWYFLRYTSTEYDDRPWDQERVQRWLPVDHYAGGPEHTTMHHLYARFIAHALYDLGHLLAAEPFKQLRLHGMITRDGAKMSKSRGNVISPDSYIAEYGADILRMYMLFLGPWQEGGDFSAGGISGVARFVGRVWNLFTDHAAPGEAAADDAAEVERRRHRLIARVTAAIEELRFHVGIAALMEELNWLHEHAGRQSTAQWRQTATSFALLLAPFAPHLAEELWERLGQPYSIHQQPWPVYAPALLSEPVVELPVQVDGKVRDRITVARDAADEAIGQAALASERVQASLHGRKLRRLVVVPGRVVNVVTSDE